MIVTLNLGLLSMAVFAFVVELILDYPTSLDPSVWYFDIGLIGPGLLLASALYGFWIALAGKPVFREEL